MKTIFLGLPMLMTRILSSLQKLTPLILIVLLSLLTGCAWFIKNPMVVEHDEVKDQSRVRRNFIYKDAEEKASPFYHAKQTILKETHSAGSPVYSSYDVISMSANSYPMEKEIYLLIDQTIYPISVESITAENKTHIQEDTDDIMAIDSTEVTIVTGYNQYNSIKYKLHYSLSSEIIHHISTAEKVRFRYYAGPEMITLKMTNGNIRKLKKLINT
ncbi:hypothetical protein [Echinicola vietnamensis]|uniref:hypothetical protein n=1 Tax=Echinicola vietnamensis TaxID=390884 RepID=UPI0012FA5E3F|nr:hypothetical protein [Echinicola vietnamensis]